MDCKLKKCKLLIWTAKDIQRLKTPMAKKCQSWFQTFQSQNNLLE